MTRSGRLYLVATPIGCLEDITLRALRVLKEVDLIAAEDTRRAKILLNHYDIVTPLISYHEHNERIQTPRLMARLLEGAVVALISDAGTPCLSDPGFVLVREAIRQGIPVEPVPGPNAAISALIISGAPVHRFLFEGFLPAKSMARRRRLNEINARYSDLTVIVFESPQRLIASLSDLASVMPDRYVAVCRELTKRYETCWRGKTAALAASLRDETIKGECVLVIAPSGVSGP